MGRSSSMKRVAACVLIAFTVTLTAAGPASSYQPGTQPGVHDGTTDTELRIMRFYAAVLDRQPDAGGMAYWYDQLASGTPVTTIADAFAVSREFQLRFGVPPGPDGDARFLAQVYRNVLDRGPDPAGERYWLGLLDAGVPRSQVVLWFSESDEFIRRTGFAPPDRPAFEGRIETVTAEELGVSWRPGCPVPPEDLRKLVMSHIDFAGEVQSGELVVHEQAADDMLIVFGRMYDAGYPIQSMRTVDEFGASDDASMDANNTSAFNCRNAVFSSSWSRHAYGLAVDINPLVNPYVKGSVVLPPVGAPFADRTVHNPGLIRAGDVVVRSFDAIGWRWGGNWFTLKDYQHFDISPRTLN